MILLTVALVTAPALGQTADPAGSIEDVTYSGDGFVSGSDDGLLLWRAAAHRFTVTVATTAEFDADVCLVGNSTGHELGCQAATLRTNTTESVAVAVGQWPVNMTGERRLDVVVRRANGSTPVARQSLAVTVLERGGDLDHDSLSNEREVAIGTDPRLPDTDGDGLSDSSEVLTYDTSPVHADSDRDGLPDGAEIETHRTNPIQPDTDGDGLLDGRELELGTSPFNSDSDGDGISDSVEVNTYGTDPTAADTDADGLDDGAELTSYLTNPMETDTDGDGLSDALEVITYETNPGDPDTDDDGLIDGAEVTEYRTEPTVADTDGDGLDDGAEVNIHGTNPLNDDTDGDGLTDGAEVNRHETNPLAIDSDGDGTSDRLEVQTGMFPDLPATGLLVGGVVVTLAAATVGFYRVSGHVPGHRAIVAVAEKVRTNERGDETRSADEPHEEDASGSDIPAEMEDVLPEFLSNEERVLRLLDDYDGQVRQSDIVEETDWSKAKVSRVLSNMEEEGKVAKINIGRENVVARPEEVPSGANSPFES